MYFKCRCCDDKNVIIFFRVYAFECKNVNVRGTKNLNTVAKGEARAPYACTHAGHVRVTGAHRDRAQLRARKLTSGNFHRCAGTPTTEYAVTPPFVVCARSLNVIYARCVRSWSRRNRDLRSHGQVHDEKRLDPGSD